MHSHAPTFSMSHCSSRRSSSAFLRLNPSVQCCAGVEYILYISSWHIKSKVASMYLHYLCSKLTIREPCLFLDADANAYVHAHTRTHTHTHTYEKTHTHMYTPHTNLIGGQLLDLFIEQASLTQLFGFSFAERITHVLYNTTVHDCFK